MIVYVVIECGYGYKEPIPSVFASKEEAEKYARRLRVYNRLYTIDECIVR